MNGQPNLPNASAKWLQQVTLRTIPVIDSSIMEAESACWIESLSAWIVDTPRERRDLARLLPQDTTILLASELP